MRVHRLFLSMSLLTIQATFADSVLDQAQNLVNSKKYIQAYDLLAPLEDERAGQPDYDYI